MSQLPPDNRMEEVNRQGRLEQLPLINDQWNHMRLTVVSDKIDVA